MEDLNSNGCLNHLFQVQESLYLLHIQVQESFHSSCRISSTCSTCCISWIQQYISWSKIYSSIYPDPGYTRCMTRSWVLLATYCLNSNTVCFNGTTTPQKIAWPRDSKIKLSFDNLATWVHKFQKLNTIQNPPKKCRKQVIKTFSMREGW